MSARSRNHGRETKVHIRGLNELIERLGSAATKLPAAVRYAVNAAVNDIRDQARAKVPSLPYDLEHNAWGIKAIASRKHPYTALVGYYADLSDGNAWHLKFYESGAKRRKRGSIMGGHFLQSLHSSADSISQRYMDVAISNLLKGAGLN